MKSAQLILGEQRLWNEARIDVTNACNKAIIDPSIPGKSIVMILMADYSRLNGKYSIKAISHSTPLGTFRSFLEQVSETFSLSNADQVNKLLSIEDDTITYLVGSAVISRGKLSRYKWVAELVDSSWLLQSDYESDKNEQNPFIDELRSDLKKINESCMQVPVPS